MRLALLQSHPDETLARSLLNDMDAEIAGLAAIYADPDACTALTPVAERITGTTWAGTVEASQSEKRSQSLEILFGEDCRIKDSMFTSIGAPWTQSSAEVLFRNRGRTYTGIIQGISMTGTWTDFGDERETGVFSLERVVGN